jgi:hypothetical protein
MHHKRNDGAEFCNSFINEMGLEAAAKAASKKKEKPLPLSLSLSRFRVWQIRWLAVTK